MALKKLSFILCIFFVSGVLSQRSALIISHADSSDQNQISVTYEKSIPSSFSPAAPLQRLYDLRKVKSARPIETMVLVSEKMFKQFQRDVVRGKNPRLLGMRFEDLIQLRHTNKDLKPLYAALEESTLGKAIVGYGLGDSGSIELYLEDLESDFLEPSFAASFKKTLIARRKGIPLAKPLKALFVSFSESGLGKNDLNGAVGLIASSGEKVLAQTVGSCASIAQVTVYGMIEGSFIGAKGTFGIPVSPLQKKIVAMAGDADVVINLDECQAYGKTSLPLPQTVATIDPGTVLVMRSLDDVPLMNNPITLKTLMLLENAHELVQAYLRSWLKEIRLTEKLYSQGCISRDVAREKIKRLSYEFYTPTVTRYLWADETLPLDQCRVPFSLRSIFKPGDNLAILSHPLLFDKTYAVVKVSGYTCTSGWVLNPTLARYLQRDHDGDAIAVADTRVIVLKNPHVPTYADELSTKCDFDKTIVRDNKTILDSLFAQNQCAEAWTHRQCFGLYTLLLQAHQRSVIENIKIPVARFISNSTSVRKKSVRQEYDSEHLSQFIEGILQETGLSSYFVKPAHEPFGIIKSPLERRISMNHRAIRALNNVSSAQARHELLDEIDFSQTTGISIIDTIWSACVAALNKIEA